MTVQRWAACVEYDGSGYSGWQAQSHAPSIQEAVEAALSAVADHPLRVVCCGRTDAGVHAFGQVIHFDSDATRPAHAWVFGANSHLPADVALRWARRVDADFHARYSALVRDYRYLILNHPARSPLFARRAAPCRHPLDTQRMAQAGRLLVGERDFSAFRAAACQAKSPVRRIHRLRVERRGDFVLIDVRANAFLHHMVRNIAGSLMTVGRGLRPPAWIDDLLAGRDRRAAGVTAPAQGLYFLGPEYPSRFDLPARPEPDLLLPSC